MKCNAQWTNFQSKPEKKNKDGLQAHPPYATITLRVDMDTPEAEAAVLELIQTLNKGEYVTVDINSDQLRLAL